MPALEYLSGNSLISYPFKDGRAVNSYLPLGDDTFLDALFVISGEVGISRPYISHISTAQSVITFELSDVVGGLFGVVELPTSSAVNHLDSVGDNFFHVTNSTWSAKFVFGPGIFELHTPGINIQFTPDETEFSPSVVIHTVPMVTALNFESYHNDGTLAAQTPEAVHIYSPGEEAKMTNGSNNVFNFLSPETMYLDIQRGAGTGLHDPCASGNITDIYSINRITPDSQGSMFFSASDCYSMELLTYNDTQLYSFIPDIASRYGDFATPIPQIGNTPGYTQYFNAIAPEMGGHGLVMQNHCQPKCPPQNLNAFAEYLNRVTDGAAELYKFVSNSYETYGTGTLSGDIFTVEVFCGTTLPDNWVSGVCSGSFTKYFHEGKTLQIRYDSTTIKSYKILDVLSNSAVRLNLEATNPPTINVSGPAPFKILELGIKNKLNSAILTNNEKLLTKNVPSIDINYGTVEAYNAVKDYGTFITAIVVIYNPTPAPLNFSVSWDTNNITKVVPSSIKTKTSSGVISYGGTVGIINCKDYATFEAIFFIPCSTSENSPNEGSVTFNVLNTADNLDLENSPKSVMATAATCVSADQAIIYVKALEGAPFSYYLPVGPGVTSLSFSGNAPNWLTFDNSITPGAGNLHGTPTGSVSGSYTISAGINSAGGSTAQTIVLTYVAKPRIVYPEDSSTIQIYPPDTNSRTYTEGAPLTPIVATNSPSGYSIVGAPLGLRQVGNGLIGQITLGSNPTFPINYVLTMSASNEAGESLPVTVNLELTNVPISTPAATYGTQFCYSIISGPEVLSQSVITSLPNWLSFNPAVNLVSSTTPPVCSLSGMNTSYSGKPEIVIVRQNLKGGSYRLVQYIIPYSSIPNITYPTPGAIFNVYPPNFVNSGDGATVFTAAYPLLKVYSTNTTTSFNATGLPLGLSIDNSGNIVGKITSGAGIYSTTITATNSVGTSPPVTFSFDLLDQVPTINAYQGKAFCYKFPILNNASSFSISGDIPPWLTVSSSVNTSCHISSAKLSQPQSQSYNLLVSADINKANISQAQIINYVALPKISYPTSGQVINLTAADYQNILFTTDFPLATIIASNSPTSYSASGLPTGLSITPNGKIIGKTSATAGDYDVVLTATNGAGSESISVTFHISSSGIRDLAFPNMPYCYKIAGFGAVDRYEYSGTLPDWLTFDGSPTALCNLYGTGTGTTGEVYDLTLTGYNGTSSTSLPYTLSYAITPTITYPIAGSIFTITPPDYNSKVFTLNSPLFKVTATNNPTTFRATGFPSNTFSIDPATGSIIGSTRTVTTNTPTPITITAVNAAGTSESITVYLVVSSTSQTLGIDGSTGEVCSLLSLADNPTGLTLTGLPSWLTFSYPAVNNCNISGTIPTGQVSTQSFTAQLTRIYGTGSTVQNLLISITRPPVITSPDQNIYDIAPPDFNSRIYTTLLPLLTVQATNNPTSFSATGLPPGLTINSSGRVIGGPVTVVGDYAVSITATNSVGSSSTALCTISVTNSIKNITVARETAICEKIITADGATVYSTVGKLPSGISFNGSPNINCNFSGTPLVSNPVGVYPINITSKYLGGSSTSTTNLNLIAVPKITYPISSAIFKIYPPDFTAVSGDSTTFTAGYPLLTVLATNSPISFSATGLPSGLTIDNSGNIVGKITSGVGTFNVSVIATNSVGTSSALSFSLSLVNTVPIISAYQGKDLCYKFPILSNATAYSLSGDVPPWVTVNTSASAACHISATNPSLNASTTYELVLSTVIGGANIKQSQVIKYTASPKISSPQANLVVSVSDLITFTENYPAVAVFASNSPTLYSCTPGLPAGLSITKTGKVIGKVGATAGNHNVAISATNAAGSDSVVVTFNVVRSSNNTLSSAAIFGESYCFKIQGMGTATSYGYSGTLPEWLTFNSDVGATCNLYGTATGLTNEIYNITLIGYYGDSSVSYNFSLQYSAKPTITYPIAGSVFTITPPDYKSKTFTLTAPLFKAAATNNPTSFTATGFSENTLTIDASSGAIIGSTRTATTSSPIPITITAINAAGSSAPVIVYLVVKSTTQILNINGSNATICQLLDNTDNPTGLTLTGLPSWLTFNYPAVNNCNISGTIPTGQVSTQSFTTQLTRIYGTGSTVQNLLISITQPPVITSPNQNKYDIAPPDFNSRVYTTSSPLLTVQTTNSPISFSATGLPPGLTVDSLGRVIGGPVTVVGDYAVSIAATNSVGSSALAYCTIAVTSNLKNITLTKETPVCEKINTEDAATIYSISGKLPSGISFNGSPSINCNFSGTPLVSNTVGAYPILITSKYLGGSSTSTTNLNLIDVPKITYPVSATTFKIYPPDFTTSGADTTTFTDVSPLLTVLATNSPISFAATGLPSGLSITNQGNIVGKITESSGTFNVSVVATNSVGASASLVFNLSLSNVSPTINAYQGKDLCYKFPILSNATSYSLSGDVPPWITINPSTKATCHISATSQTISANNVYNFVLNAVISGANIKQNQTLNYTAIPQISSPSTNSTVGVVDLVTFTENYPAIAITANNNPTTYTCNPSLPAGLSLSTSGKVIGKVSAAAGNYSVTLSATNSAGSSSVVVNFVVSRTTNNTLSSVATENNQYCYKISGLGLATSYGYSGTLPPWLTFDGGVSATCNLYGTGEGATNETYNLTLIGYYGNSSVSVNFSLRYSAKPTITYPIAGSIFTITPPDYNSKVFTLASPLFKAAASNNPTSFEATGFNANTLRIDSASGAIIGSTGPLVINTPVPISITAINSAGRSQPVTVYLQVNSTSQTINIDGSSNSVCSLLNLSDNPTGLTITGLPSWLYLNYPAINNCTISGTIPSLITTNQTFTTQLTRSYGVGATLQKITFNVVRPPVITSPNQNKYDIAPPDFNSRVYTTSSPLLTIQTTNTPTTITATGLPPGLTVDSLGRVIGGPVTVTGTYNPEFTAHNFAGSSTASCEILATNITEVISALEGVALCKSIITRDGATSYSLSGALPTGLVFDGSPAAPCSFSGTPTGASNTGVFPVDILSTYVGGSSKTTVNFNFVAVPKITTTTATYRILPSTYISGSPYTDSQPIISISSLNDPTAFSATGLPPGLTVTCYGNIVGSLSAQSVGLYSVSVTAANSAGTSKIYKFSLDLTKKKSIISWSNPQPMVYGTALSETQLNAEAKDSANIAIPGIFTYSPSAGQVLSAGTKTLSVTFTPNNSVDIDIATKSVSINISKITPTITWANPNPIDFGTLLGDTQLNATVDGAVVGGQNISIAGKMVYSPAPLSTPNAGTDTLTATFTPTDTLNYSTARKTVTILVEKIHPYVSWPTPSTIIYGTALTNSQLNAKAYLSESNTATTVSGTFTYSPILGSVLDAPAQTLTTTFIPTTPSNYLPDPVVKTVQITIEKATPTIVWPSPASLTYGEFLSSTQLNASEKNSVPGVFSYSPASGVKLNSGSSQTLSTTFTPTASNNYKTVSTTTKITVNKATPTINWDTPSPISYGTPLSTTQLNASVQEAVPGVFEYLPAIGTVLAGGSKSLQVTFTPEDLLNYNKVTRTVSILVNPATPVITWPAITSITYGTLIGVTQLNAEARNPNGDNSIAPGTLTYSVSSGTKLNADTYSLTVSFTPSDIKNFNSVTGTNTLIVNKVIPRLLWGSLKDITYPKVLTTELNATAVEGTSTTVSGTFEYTDSGNNILTTGSLLNAGYNTITAKFSPTDTVNYAIPANITNTLQVLRGFPYVTWETRSPSTLPYSSKYLGLDHILGAYTASTGAVAVPGVFSKSPESLTKNTTSITPPNNTLQISGGFTPTDTANWYSVSKAQTIYSSICSPTVTWSTPAPLSLGGNTSVTLTSAQLNAVVTDCGGDPALGTIVYTPPIGSTISETTVVYMEFTSSNDKILNAVVYRTVAVTS